MVGRSEDLYRGAGHDWDAPEEDEVMRLGGTLLVVGLVVLTAGDTQEVARGSASQIVVRP